MDNFGEDVLIPIVAIFCAVVLPIVIGGYLITLVVKSKTQERMELIKQGIIPSTQAKPIPNKYISLRNGFICLGIALGLMVGIILDNVLVFKSNITFLIITAPTLFFLGLSYVIFYFIIRNKNLED